MQRRINISPAKGLAERRAGDHRRALTLPSVSPDRALLRPATVIYTRGRASASYLRSSSRTCSGVLCAEPMCSAASSPKPRAGFSDLLAVLQVGFRTHQNDDERCSHKNSIFFLGL